MFGEVGIWFAVGMVLRGWIQAVGWIGRLRGGARRVGRGRAGCGFGWGVEVRGVDELSSGKIAAPIQWSYGLSPRVRGNLKRPAAATTTRRGGSSSTRSRHRDTAHTTPSNHPPLPHYRLDTATPSGGPPRPVGSRTVGTYGRSGRTRRGGPPDSGRRRDRYSILSALMRRRIAWAQRLGEGNSSVVMISPLMPK